MINPFVHIIKHLNSFIESNAPTTVIVYPRADIDVITTDASMLEINDFVDWLEASHIIMLYGDEEVKFIYNRPLPEWRTI